MTERTETRRTRRDEAIAHAADLLRDGGPGALTSVAVAERMGVTQSAVYRHIRDMEELSELAAKALIDELNALIEQVLLDPDVDWEHIDDVDRLCRALIGIMVANERSFGVLDQLRFSAGSLGEGIQRIVDQGRDIVAAVLEHRWRTEFGYDAALSAVERRTMTHHAESIHDDGLAVARLVRAAPFEPGIDLDALALVLRYRILGGWVALVIDMNERAGLPFPRIDLDEGIVIG